MANIDDKYIAIQKWMVTQLELTGNELIIYGYIYSFQFKSFWNKETPEKVTPTEIPLRDFMDWTRSNKKNTILAIQRLESKGYISVITNAGHINKYAVNPAVVTKAISGVSSDTSVKKTPVSKQHQSGVSSGTTGGVSSDTRVVSKQHQSGVEMTPHSIRNTKNTQIILEYKNAHTREDASAPSLSTDDGNGNGDDRPMTKAEQDFYEKQALKKLRETDPETNQKTYLSRNPAEQFPKAYAFMDEKKTTAEYNDTEFELFKMISLFTAYGVARKEKTVTQEEAEYVPPASEIGKEAHDAQKAFVDWVFHGGESPIQMARRK